MTKQELHTILNKIQSIESTICDELENRAVNCNHTQDQVLTKYNEMYITEQLKKIAEIIGE